MRNRKVNTTLKRKRSSPVASTEELLPKLEFLKRYGITKKDFDTAGLNWDDLVAIHKDYLSLRSRLEHPARAIVDILFSKTAREQGVHSVRYRVKDANGLVEKVIRKKIHNPKRVITVSNYREEITDLIGIRALHVFKTDIYGIHQFIVSTFSLKEKEQPILYHREGDEQQFIDMCTDCGCRPEKHHKGYRSVHYIVATQLTKERHYAEIQVRTVFEEGWSEVDHKIRYSFKGSSATPFDAQLRILNGIAGSADESGSAIRKLEQEQQQKILKPKPKGKR
jgi:putative GTP pyrophosphokinase